MGLLSKIMMCLVVAVAILGVASVGAAAQVDVHAEAQAEETCGELTLTGHHVEGGCRVAIHSQGGVPLYAYAPARVELANCEWKLEAQIGEDGEGYVTVADLEDTVPPASVPCARAPCDEAGGTHPMLPWPVHLLEVGGQLSLELRFCFRNISAGEGGGFAYCTLHLDMTDNGGHQYEIGNGAETFCEPGDLPLPVSFEAHLVTGGDCETPEAVEIVH